MARGRRIPDFSTLPLRAVEAWVDEWLARGGAAAGRRVLPRLEADSRRAVQRLARRLRARLEAAEAETARLARLHRYEREARDRGARLVAGADEARKGPLAGPVVAAAVILPPEVFIPGLNDSKQLTPAGRTALYREICSVATAVGLGVVGVDRIERLNIFRAGLLALGEAVRRLDPRPDHVLVDGGWPIPHLGIDQTAIVRGDAKSASIAAASIVAKVARDRIMGELDRDFPGYGLARHKGYATREHVEAILRLGPAPVHRRRFLRKLLSTRPG